MKEQQQDRQHSRDARKIKDARKNSKASNTRAEMPAAAPLTFGMTAANKTIGTLCMYTAEGRSAKAGMPQQGRQQ
jgi:hypothetical protein